MTLDQIATAEDVRRLEAKLDELRAMLEQPAPEWLTITEAAARLGCSADTIRRRIKSGELEARGAGKLRQVKV